MLNTQPTAMCPHLMTKDNDANQQKIYTEWDTYLID